MIHKFEMEENLTSYKGYRIDDTAEWRLVIYLSAQGMSAYLKNIENPLEQIVTLFEEKWQEDESALLRRIETAVYDHPQLLDDFSTEIVICTSRPLWIPDEFAGDYEEQARLYNIVYKAEEEDIFSESFNGMTCLFTLAPGLQSFLRRTISGARISSHLGVLARRFTGRGGEMPRIYVDIREGMADFVALDDRKMLLAATHAWRSPDDIAYHVFNLMDIYGLDPANTQVSFSGLREVKQQLVKQLREQISFVMLTMMPSAVQKSDMPITAAIALAKS